MGKFETHNMEYNSEKDNLIIPEYGRNVQMLIEHAKTIENNEMRQAFVEKIVDLMHQMHPQNRNIDDYRSKLWKHIFRIAKYEIDVIPPNGEIPTPETDLKKPEKVEYPASNAEFRHYGNNVQILIDKALKMEEGTKKDGFVSVIGAYMKMAYRTWNKEFYVSDEIIKQDLFNMSQGKLAIDEATSLDGLTNANKRKRKPSDDSSSRGRDSHRGRSGGDRGGRGRGGDRNNRGRNSGGRNHRR